MTSIALAVRERRVSATRVVTASIELLERAEALNVLAEKAYDEALERARQIDDGDAPVGALLGVPTLIKDLEDLLGHPTRKGSRALREAPLALTNGVVPERLISAGAIVVGKSTLPEFAIEGFTANLLTGITRNPWNLEYSPGGSSGARLRRSQQGSSASQPLPTAVVPFGSPRRSVALSDLSRRTASLDAGRRPTGSTIRPTDRSPRRAMICDSSLTSCEGPSRATRRHRP